MITNTLKIAFRSIWKTRGHSFLNIVGLSIGIVCAALIFLWIEDEYTFNTSFSNIDNLYITKSKQVYNGKVSNFDATPGMYAPAAKAEIPGIKNTARTTWPDQLLFAIGDKSIYQTGSFADPSYFSMFKTEFVKGNSTNAFSNLQNVVISEKMANNFFGTTDVIGKALKVDNDKEYIVSGVMKDLPNNVSGLLKPDWLMPFAVYESQNEWLKSWGNNGVESWVELESIASMESINKKLEGFIKSKDAGVDNSVMNIYPINRMRLYNNFDENGIEQEGRMKQVRLFNIIAWIILLIACINFMNLATARASKRAKEVGVKKTLGALRGRLIMQFISESVLLSTLSALLAIVLLWLALPAFNNMVEKKIALDLFSRNHIIWLLGITLICGIVAGLYPAFYLSAFKPMSALKEVKLKTSSAALVRRGLVVLQFSASVVFIICTIIIYQQIQFGKNLELGYQQQQLIYTRLYGNASSHFEAIRQQLIATGVVKEAGLGSSNILNMYSNTGAFDWQGKDPNKDILITITNINANYIPTMGMQLLDGRNFNPNALADSNNIIVNETFAKMLAKKEAVGSLIRRGEETKYTIVGVVKDFVYNNVYQPVAPLVFFADNNCDLLNIRLKDNVDVSSALAKVESVIKPNIPGYPFEYHFLDDEFDASFKSERLMGELASVFAVLAIIISCIGLFGLSAFTAERRTKEIGIRKVLGASVAGLTGLLSKEFLVLVSISLIIAFPFAWWMMHNWLQDFTYRTSIHWWVFLLAGLIILFVTLITVSFQSIKAAIANPIKSLRTE
jgi:putative ABC transport system permease protein